MTAIVLRGDAAALPLPDASVDLIVTSPPYFGLRSYTDGGEHYEGQVGDEATPAEYLDALIACAAEWMRVLKPGGSIFVNLGDAYARNGGGGAGSSDGKTGRNKGGRPPTKTPVGIREKSLTGLPWRYAIRCIDELGLILRAEIIWSKPNGLPESVTDRVRRSHEQVFHLVKSPRYYTAVDEIRDEYAPASLRSYSRGGLATSIGTADHGSRDHNGPLRGGGDMEAWRGNPLGKLPGSVWSIPTAPLTVPEHVGVDHFAAFPPELVRRIILGWSPREVCCVCGEGRRPMLDREPSEWDARKAAGEPMRHGLKGAAGAAAGNFKPLRGVLSGYACGCPDATAPTTRGVVLDPFGGTGTTALVASCYGRVGITVDLSADYCRLATWRTHDPGERARALDVPKPERPVDGQLDLFAEDLA